MVVGQNAKTIPYIIRLVNFTINGSLTIEESLLVVETTSKLDAHASTIPNLRNLHKMKLDSRLTERFPQDMNRLIAIGLMAYCPKCGGNAKIVKIRRKSGNARVKCEKCGNQTITKIDETW